MEIAMESVNTNIHGDKIDIPIGRIFQLGTNEVFESVQEIFSQSKHVKANFINAIIGFTLDRYDKEIVEPLLSSPTVIVEPSFHANSASEYVKKMREDFKSIDSLKLPFPKMTFFSGEKYDEKATGNVDTITPYFISESSEGIIVTLLGVSDSYTPGLFKLIITLDKERGFSMRELEKPSLSLGYDILQEAYARVILTIYRMTLGENDFYMSIPSPRDARKNKNRVAKGKKPLIEFKIVKIKGRKTNVNPDAPKGTHASPRQHWRRGHWRTLSKTGKKVWVSASQVGDEANGKIIKAYAVGEVE